jgi:hypothetical protein
MGGSLASFSVKLAWQPLDMTPQLAIFYIILLPAMKTIKTLLVGEDLGKFDSRESAASVSSEVMTDSLQSSSQSATLWPPQPGS